MDQFDRLFEVYGCMVCVYMEVGEYVKFEVLTMNALASGM
jgi:hypothetical protein